MSFGHFKVNTVTDVELSERFPGMQIAWWIRNRGSVMRRCEQGVAVFEYAEGDVVPVA